MHNEIIRDAFREFGGYEVRSDGDSFMIAFSSAKNACSFSVKVTETLLQVLTSSYFSLLFFFVLIM